MPLRDQPKSGFERQSGSNLMIVGQREDAVEAMTAIGLRLLRAQMGERARLILIDGQVTDPNSFKLAERCPDQTWIGN